MKKNIRFFLVAIVLIVAYVAFIIYYDHHDDAGSSPVISTPDEVLTISVYDDESVILEGVSASDEEDGDLTSHIYIESISAFDENQQRTVTFTVFDSDDNIVRATRKIAYTDYSAPVIDITKALCIYYVTSTEEYKDYVSAYSVVDGDLSASISIASINYDADNNQSITYSVTDSCGVTATETFDVTSTDYYATIDIELANYLIRVPVGTQVYGYGYLVSVTEDNISHSPSDYSISISSNFDAYTPGTYEFVYRIDKGTSYGITKLTVIVVG